MEFTPKQTAETEVFTFDFGPLLARGETLVSGGLSVSVLRGVDANPTALLDGGPELIGSQLRQRITGGVAGVGYCLTATVTTSSTQQLRLSASLRVINPCHC